MLNILQESIGGGGGGGGGRKGNEKRDVKFHMSFTAQNNNDVNRKKKEHGTESKETKRQSDMPLVAILHDSVLNGVQGKKIGTILWINILMVL